MIGKYKTRKCYNTGVILLVQNVKWNSNCDALRDLVPFVQFKKREKHTWRSVNFSKVAGCSPQLRKA